MIIDSIENGIVIDHIDAGGSMKLYQILNLGDLECSVAIIKNANSRKMGKKDIIKINELIDLNFDVLGYINPDITVNIIKDCKRKEKLHMEMPSEVENVIKCTNPRCITSVETGISHIFKLKDKERRIYRCVYCESRANEKYD